jgi:hypothetical protein
MQKSAGKESCHLAYERTGGRCAHKYKLNSVFEMNSIETFQSFLFIGAGCRIRTKDLLITNHKV